MPKRMGTFCKAIPLWMLREYPRWREDRDGSSRLALSADDHLYLQEDFGVTAGVYLEEDLIFSDPTQEWRDFCRERLGFAPDSG